MINVLSGVVGFTAVSTDVTFTNNVPSAAIFAFGTTLNTATSTVNPDEVGCNFTILNASTLRIQRGQSGTTTPSCVASYFIVKAMNEEFVVTNRTVCSIVTDTLSAILPVPITSPSTTLIVWSESMANGATDVDSGSLYCSMFVANASTLIFRRNVPTLSADIVSYQTVVFQQDAGIVITSGYTVLSAAMAVGTPFNLSLGKTINPSSTWIYSKFSHASSTPETIGITVRINANNSSLDFARNLATVLNSSASWFVVQFPSQVCCTHITDQAANADFTEDTPLITTVSPSSVIFQTVDSRTTTTSSLGQVAFTAQFLDPNNIRSSRGSSGTQSNIVLHTADFANWKYYPTDGFNNVGINF